MTVLEKRCRARGGIFNHGNIGSLGRGKECEIKESRYSVKWETAPCLSVTKAKQRKTGWTRVENCNARVEIELRKYCIDISRNFFKCLLFVPQLPLLNWYGGYVCGKDFILRQYSYRLTSLCYNVLHIYVIIRSQRIVALKGYSLRPLIINYLIYNTPSGSMLSASLLLAKLFPF